MDDTSTISSSHIEPLGEILLAARTAKKLSQKDVSNNLRFSLNQINSLENNDFSALPQPMITRGFIRNYARLLEIDAEPLLASYRIRVPEKTPYAVSVQSTMYQVMSGKDSMPWLKYILGSIFILLFLLAWILYIDYMPKSTKSKTEIVPASTTISPLPTLEALPEVALPAAERINEVVIDSTTTAEPTIVDSTKAPELAANVVNSTNNTNSTPPSLVPVDQVALQSNIAQKERVSVTPVPNVAAKTLPTTSTSTTKAQPVISTAAVAPLGVAQTVVNTKTNKVSMSFNAPTWVQVTDKSGKIIFEKILSAGSVDGLDGEKPFNIVIGNAKATKLSFLGKAVDLTPYTTENNVARLKLE